MLTMQPQDGMEKYLCDRAFQSEIPLSGTFELLPICNMDCRMCYIRISKQEMQKQGISLTAQQWIDIGKQAVQKGTMFLLLTGGEPLLYSEFDKVYTGLRELGIFVTVNTNGTLINPGTVELFKRNMPRRVNISLYGSSNAVYGNLCRNPKGFTQTMAGIHMLLEADVPVKLNYTLTKENQHELDAIMKISDEIGVPISVPTYMFPSARKKDGSIWDSNSRLSPREMAEKQFEILYKNFHQEKEFKENISEMLINMKEKSCSESCFENPPGGFLCSAGVSSYWVNWRGGISACGMLDSEYSLLEESFDTAWNKINAKTKDILTSSKCFHCGYRKICHTCAASAYIETGDFGKEVPYHCEFCKEYESILQDYLEK